MIRSTKEADTTSTSVQTVRVTVFVKERHSWVCFSSLSGHSQSVFCETSSLGFECMFDFHVRRKGNFENIHLLRAKCLRASIGKGIVLTNVRKVERNLTRKLQVARAALVIVKADLRAIYSSIRPYNYDKFRRQLIIRRNQLTRVYFQTLSSLLEAYLTLTLAELHHAEVTQNLTGAQTRLFHQRKEPCPTCFQKNA